jgi:hypothetical protein
MPRRGPAPKDASRRRRTNSPDEWTDVPNVPYTGPRPALPRSRKILRAGQLQTVPITEQTRRWWRVVTSMPHCAVWDSGEWQYALTTAIVADNVHYGINAAVAPLTARERVMGTTPDARLALRIRYTDPNALAIVHALPPLPEPAEDYRDL